MNSNRQENLEKLLRGEGTPEPPRDLLHRIKSEIPAQLPRPGVAPAGPSRWTGWKLAASVLFLVGFGYIFFSLGVRYDYQREKDETFATAAPTRRAVLSKEVADTQQESITVNAAPAPPPPPVAAANQVRTAQGRRDKPLDEAKVNVAERVSADRAHDAPAAPSEIPAAAPPPPPSVMAEALPEAAPREPVRAQRQEAPAKREEAPAKRMSGVVGGIASSEERERQAAPTVTAPSTGGTAEPNDAPYGDTFFRHYGTNPFVDTEDDPISTFALDVDTASYSVVRRFLNERRLPPADAIRVEEFVNSFNYGDAPPARSDLALYAEAAESPFPPGLRYATIRFGIQAKQVSAARRAPAVLTFVVDTSGSMARENRLEMVKRALVLLLDQLREDDEVGLVSFGDSAEILVEPTANHDAVRRAIARLTPRGSTNAAAGLRLGYEASVGAFRRGANNRVIFCSDGVANVGATSADAILQQVDVLRSRGVMLTTIGVGMGNFNDVLLEQLANRGNGTYAYIDDVDEAHRAFVENLTGTLQTVAEDARAQVRFNPSAVSRYRLIGYENRHVADDRFRDDTTDAGEIGAGHGVTVLYEVKLQPEVSPRTEIATLTLRYRPAGAGRFRELDRTVRAGEISSWDDAPAHFKLATLVATFAEVLKHSYWVREISPAEVAASLRRLGVAFRGDERVRELIRLAETAAQLRAPAE